MVAPVQGLPVPADLTKAGTHAISEARVVNFILSGEGNTVCSGDSTQVDSFYMSQGPQ